LREIQIEPEFQRILLLVLLSRNLELWLLHRRLLLLLLLPNLIVGGLVVGVVVVDFYRV
jgi:hypothetical protein